jgi:DDE superfamily endonuclease
MMNNTTNLAEATIIDLVLAEMRPIGCWSRYTIQRRILGRVLQILGNDVWKHCPNGTGDYGVLEQLFTDCKFGICDVSNSTIRRWFNHFIMFGETPEESKRIKRRFYRGTSHIFSTDDSDVMVLLVKAMPELYLDEIQKLMRLELGKTFTCITIWRELKRRNYSLQVACDQASQRSEEERDQYIKVLNILCYRPGLLIFLDETQKSRNAARRRRHWSCRGSTPVRKVGYYGPDFDPRYTMIGACDMNGFIQEACEVIERERGSTDRDDTRGTVDRARFEMWVEQRLVPVLGCFEKGDDRSIVVLDNASVHHGARVVELIEGTGATILYLPPYSPDFNPIELFFNQYKMALRRFSTSSQMDWIEKHVKALESVSARNAQNYFRKCMIPGCQAFDEEDTDDSNKELLFKAHHMNHTLQVQLVAMLVEDDF